MVSSSEALESVTSFVPASRFLSNDLISGISAATLFIFAISLYLVITALNFGMSGPSLIRSSILLPAMMVPLTRVCRGRRGYTMLPEAFVDVQHGTPRPIAFRCPSRSEGPAASNRRGCRLDIGPRQTVPVSPVRERRYVGFGLTSRLTRRGMTVARQTPRRDRVLSSRAVRRGR